MSNLKAKFNFTIFVWDQRNIHSAERIESEGGRNFKIQL